MSSEKILITGSNGQLGTVIAKRLIEKHGHDNVILSDIKEPAESVHKFEFLDILNKNALSEIFHKHNVTQVYHLAAILSATGEKIPMKCWEVNVTGYLNVLEACRVTGVKKIFFPSSIAVFGNGATKKNAPQNSALNPSTVYGMSKVSGEQWSSYYSNRYNMDIRSLRYPGVIGYQSLPGGGTTDYAVEIFHEAIINGCYTCFLKEDTGLPMIYMDDVVNATMMLMEAPKENITIRTSYNLEGDSFTPAEITKEIQKHIPEFKITYAPDERQQIADSWIDSMDDTAARKDWKWRPKFILPDMVEDMITNLRELGLQPKKKIFNLEK